jgi:hypothetical protein
MHTDCLARSLIQKGFVMLKSIAPDIWHVQHEFVVNGLPISSRMTVVRLQNGSLWLHSPIPLSPELRGQLAELGYVEFIVAPSIAHHLFVAEYLAAFPQAKLFGAPGLSEKRPDLKGMRELSPNVESEWQADLEQIFFAGIPFGNETVWFHKASRTLILTDLCQWWQGELSFVARLFASLTGVRKQLDVPKTIRWLTKDKQAAHDSAQKILAWPIERVVMAHNAIVEQDAYASLKRAFSRF